MHGCRRRKIRKGDEPWPSSIDDQVSSECDLIWSQFITLGCEKPSLLTTNSSIFLDHGESVNEKLFSKTPLHELMWMVMIDQQEIQPLTVDERYGACREPEFGVSGAVIQEMVGIGINVVTLDGLPLEKYAPTSQKNGP